MLDHKTKKIRMKYLHIQKKRIKLKIVTVINLLDIKNENNMIICFYQVNEVLHN